MSCLQSIMLLQRNVPQAAKYYSLLGFRAQLVTEGWAELDAGTVKIVLKKAECATHMCVSMCMRASSFNDIDCL
jgi:hypothetical protein